VVGDLTGDVTGDVTGAVTGNVTGDVTGNLTGNVTGNLTGDITGDVTGDVTGDITGDVTGDLTGAVTATGTLADGVTAATQTAGTNDTTVATTAYVDALNMVPAGAITQYGAASAPTGWLLCDGTAVSRTTYSALFAIVSTTYGTGDGSTTFNLPDLQDRIPVGRNDTSGTFNVALGSTGGVEDVTLTGAQSGTSAHGHTINSSAEGAAHHGHTGGGQPVGLSSAATPSVGTYSGSDGVQDSVAASAGSSHTNLQPYLVVNFIIKT
jgi:microcystin-dependent protein